MTQVLSRSDRPKTDIGAIRGAAAEALMPFPRVTDEGRTVIARQRRDVVALLHFAGRLDDALWHAAVRFRWDHERSTGHATAPPPIGTPRGGSRSPGSGWPADSVVAAAERFERASTLLHGLEAAAAAEIVLGHGRVADLARARRLRKSTVLLALRRALATLADFYTDEPLRKESLTPEPIPTRR